MQLKADSPKVVAFDEHYQAFVPAVGRPLAAQGGLRLLAQFADFGGWKLHAAWGEFGFGIKRIAVVSNCQGEVRTLRLVKPFTGAVGYISDVSAAAVGRREGL